MTLGHGSNNQATGKPTKGTLRNPGFAVIAGENVTVNNGQNEVIVSVPVATSSSLGVVEPDNTTITISGGILSASATLSEGRLVAATPGRKPLAGEVIFSVDMKTGDQLPSGLTGSLITCDIAPTSNWTITLNKNGTTIGTGTILASATSGTFTFSASVSFTDGDKFEGTAPVSQDATASGIRMTYMFTRTQ